MTQESDRQLTVDLYVRADAPVVERRRSVIDRLKRLEGQDRIEEFRVHSWPRAISLDLADEIEGDGIRDVVRSFETWAARRDRRIRPPFDVRTTHSTITGASDELLVLPVICLATYNTGNLVDVAPSSDGDSVYTVEDALDAIESESTYVPETQPDGGESSPKRERRGPTEITEQPP
jgi:hypothetical protein